MKYLYAVVVLTLAGCASHAPAPVVERAAAPAPTPASRAALPVPVTGEGAPTYTVKKGDTLYSIALEHGQDYKDVAAWNNLENPNRIQAGQQLRVSPPGAPPAEAEPVAVARPVVSSAPIEARPASANSDNFKREPKGGTVAYSEQALARLREPLPVAERVVEKPVDKTEDKPAAVPVPAGDDAIDWAWPVPGKTLRTFVEGGDGKEANKGIDLAGNMADPIYAAAAGTVKYVGSLKGYGKFLIIRHSPTMLSVYAHVSKTLVAEEQKVSRGQKIAEVGSSDADQPKLHFEIRRQGKPVDPLKYLPAR